VGYRALFRLFVRGKIRRVRRAVSQNDAFWPSLLTGKKQGRKYFFAVFSYTPLGIREALL
jgi:hypothetical protein